MLRQDILPQIIGPYPAVVRRIARTIVIAFVERHEIGCVLFQFGTHHDFVVIHGKMNNTSLKAEESLRRVSVVHILSDRIRRVLKRKLIF